MKKVLLLIVSLLFVPIMVFADMGAPGVEEYKATVINKNGAVVYEDPGEPTKQILKYGTTVTIDYEEDGYGNAGEIGYVKLTDIAPVDKDYMVNENNWNFKTTGLVLKKVNILRGPAGAYEKIGELSPGAKVTLIFNTDPNAPETAWAYVDDGKKQGFVSLLDGTIAYDPITAKVKTIYNTVLKDPKTDKKVDTIKANTSFTAKVYDLDDWSGGYYIEYNNKGYTIYKSDVTFEGVEVEFKVTRDINVYESLLDQENEEKDYKKVATLKKGDSFKSKYYDFANGLQVVYYENGNTKGWVYDMELDEVGNALDFDGTLIYGLEEDDDTEEPSEPTEVVEPHPETDVVVGPHVKNVPQMVITCLLIGLVVCATAVVTIVLVNKKKKGK